MMYYINILFGENQDLSAIQMTLRGVVVFFIALLLVRISGRRSYSFRMPLDNIIGILLGGILSRTVVGASPFIPIVITCFVIVILHRVLSWFSTKYRFINIWIEGTKIILYKDNEFIEKNMRRALVSREDIFQNLRRMFSSEDLANIDRIYLERNGDISVIRK